MLVYGVVSGETEKAIELFVRREDAERFLEDVRADGSEAGERFSLVEHPMSARALAAPLHRHTREDGYSFVLQGCMGALLGNDVVEAGDLVSKPRTSGTPSGTRATSVRSRRAGTSRAWRVSRRSVVGCAVSGEFANQMPDVAAIATNLRQPVETALQVKTRVAADGVFRVLRSDAEILAEAMTRDQALELGVADPHRDAAT